MCRCAGAARRSATFYAGNVFTGIVEELGEVVSREDLGDSARLVIRGPVVTSDAGHGDSIAVNGVCLTVVDVLADGSFSADVMAETLQRSSLREAVSGARVNLAQQGARWVSPSQQEQALVANWRHAAGRGSGGARGAGRRTARVRR